MEIADIFIVNKADRDGATKFVKYLTNFVNEKKYFDWTPPVIKTIANKHEGIAEVLTACEAHRKTQNTSTALKVKLLSDAVIRVVQARQLAKIDIDQVKARIESKLQSGATVNIFAEAAAVAS